MAKTRARDLVGQWSTATVTAMGGRTTVEEQAWKEKEGEKFVGEDVVGTQNTV